jgi:hypothetical protein
MWRWIVCILWFECACAQANVAADAVAARVPVCHGYGCARTAQATLSTEHLAELRVILGSAESAQTERILLKQAVGRVYAIAAEQTAIKEDMGGNPLEEKELNGAMDCVDHATTTSEILKLFDSQGMLRFHTNGTRVMRIFYFFFAQHWTATVVEKNDGSAWAVDTWFFPPGAPATLVPLADWKAGHDPRP